MERRLAAIARSLQAVISSVDGARLDVARAAVSSLTSAYPDSEGDDSTDPVTALRDLFGLSDVEQSIVAVAASADLDERFSVAYNAILDAAATVNRPTVGLALRLCGVDVNTVGRDALADAAPLRRNELISLEGAEPLSLRTLRVPDRVLAYLTGHQRAELDVRRALLPVTSHHGVTSAAVASAFRCGAHLVHLHSVPGSPGIAAAQAGLEELGTSSLVVDLSLRDRAARARDIVQSVVREAGLLRVGLVVTGVEDLFDRDPSLVAVINDGPALAVVVDDRDLDLPGGALTARIDASPLTRAERQEIWGSTLADVGLPRRRAEQYAAALAGMRLSPESIQATADEAQCTADRAEDLTLSTLRSIAHATGGARLTSNAVRIVPMATRGDLVLNEANERSLDQLVAWGRLRDDPRGRTLLGGRRGNSSGITALFTGPPGTGKTLAAEAVAAELELELFVVNLSQVVDKYIGETEKRLERIITESEALGVILLFDEADSIFGARSAVKDSKDRYANQTISFLLQRIERYDGIIILTSNFRGNIDPAFTRRLHHIIHFPVPDATARRQMWEVHLGVIETDPTDRVDVGQLAEQLELVGGEIRNVVMRAGFAALTEDLDHPHIGMRHLVAAATQEYAKMSKLMPAFATQPAGRPTTEALDDARHT